jgi:CPA2 family monovalent cation:H+ antiporter-2
VLESVHIERADSLAVLVNDSDEEKRIVEEGRKLNPNLFILVRTRYVDDEEPLLDLGANEVIADNYEIGQLFVRRLLTRYEVTD